MSPRIVNRCSRIVALAIALLFSIPAARTFAQDRVILVEATGNAAEERVDAVMDAIMAAIRTMGMDAEILPWNADVPQTSDEMRSLAQTRNATYIVIPTVNAMPGQYRLSLRVGYAPASRVEELDALVLEAEQE